MCTRNELDAQIVSRCCRYGHHQIGGFRDLGEPCLEQGPPSPGEARPIPAVELRERDAVARGLDEPAVAEVDACVVDLRRLRLRAASAEEEHIRGLELVDRSEERRVGKECRSRWSP